MKSIIRKVQLPQKCKFQYKFLVVKPTTIANIHLTNGCLSNKFSTFHSGFTVLTLTYYNQKMVYIIWVKVFSKIIIK